MAGFGPRDRVDAGADVDGESSRLLRRIRGFGRDDLDDFATADSEETAPLERSGVKNRDLLAEIGFRRLEGLVQRECSKGLQSHGAALLALPDAADETLLAGVGLRTIAENDREP